MLRILLEGAGDEQFDIVYRYKQREVRYKHRFGGVYQHIAHTYANTNSPKQRRWAEAFMRPLPCRECGGGRLKPEALSYKVNGKNIADLVQMDLVSLRRFFDTVDFSARTWLIAKPIVKEITERLQFMIDVGVGYLNLDRVARTLSGGESQRIRLATQIGTQLTGVLYVLDEPSIGLHPRDNNQLIDSLRHLRDLGNSVLVVEHDREMIEQPKILKYHANAAAFLGTIVSTQTSHITAKQTQPAAGWLLRQEYETKQGGLARPTRSGNEMKGAGIEREI